MIGRSTPCGATLRVAMALLFLLAAPGPHKAAGQVSRPETTPNPDHIIVIVMENHSYDQVRTQPYTASLIASGSSFRYSYAVTHPSQPNYLALWSGSLQGVPGDRCPPDGVPFFTENFGHECQAAGISWRTYAEDLPSPAYSGCTAAGGLYVRRHCPWTHFGNVNHSNERPYTQLATDIANGTLPRLAFVIPNQCHNTHDCSIADGDLWLSQQVPAMLQGVGPNGLVLLTWDEDDDHSSNRILTVLSGPLVRSGYLSPTVITHYTVVRMLCDLLGLAPIGQSDIETPVTDVWRPQDPAGIEEGSGAENGDRNPDATPERTAERIGGETLGAWLGPAVPNPSDKGFQALLSLRSELTAAPVEAVVHDITGRRLAVLRSQASQGGRILHWDGRDSDGKEAPSGLYVLSVRVGDRRLERKVVLTR